jgi:hypothetical protein
VCDHGEAADQEVPGAGFVERAADPDDVIDARCARVRPIVRVNQVSASSKLSNR